MERMNKMVIRESLRKMARELDERDKLRRENLRKKNYKIKFEHFLMYTLLISVVIWVFNEYYWVSKEYFNDRD